MDNKAEIYNIAQKQVDYVKSILSKRFAFEDNNTNEVQGGYTTYGTMITPSSIVVVRISNHICAMENWTERYKKKLIPNKKLARRMGNNLQEPYKDRCFYSIVFKAFDYSPNDNGTWNAECFEYVFNPIEVKNGDRINSIARDAFDLTGQKAIIDGLSPITRKAITSSPNTATPENNNNEEIKENRNMNKKQTIRLNESQFNNLVKKVVKESVKKVLFEERPPFLDSEIAMGEHERNFDFRVTKVIQNCVQSLRDCIIDDEFGEKIDYMFAPKIDKAIRNVLREYGLLN